MIHELKIFTEFFAAVACGVKRAELRKNDRNYHVGDTLHLCEFNQVTGMRTGEYINVTVTHIADVGAWLPGYVLLSVELVDKPVQPVPVVSDAEPSLSAMMRALDEFYADDDVPERAMLSAFRILLADVRNQAQEPVTDNTAQQFEALATSAQSEPVAAVKHYTGNEYPTLKFAQNEWCVCGDREDAQELADAINALATRAGSGKSEHLLNAERIASEAKELSDRLNTTSAIHNRVSGWSERQQKLIAYSLWRFSSAAYQKANQAAQTNNKDMFDRFIRDARCAEEIREEFTSAWVGKL